MSAYMSVYLMYGFMITDQATIDKMWDGHAAWDKLLELDVVYDPSDITYIAIGVHVKSFDNGDEHSLYTFPKSYNSSSRLYDLDKELDDLDEKLTDIISKLDKLYPYLKETFNNSEFKCGYMLFNNWA